MRHLIFLGLMMAFACGKENKSGLEKSKELWKAGDLTDSVFTNGIEGPCYYKGLLYAVNIGKDGNIAVADSSGAAKLFVELPDSSIGNGIIFNKKGMMLIADYTKHNVLIIDPGTKKISVYAHSDSMNQPNDVAIMDNDIVFASDPNWAKSTGNLWRVDTNGKMTLLESGMGTTNGIEVSPDNSRLYVNESIQRNVWVYDLDKNGNISNKRVLIKFDDFGMDGMRTDEKGNLYIARYGKGTVVVVSPEGKVIREIILKGKLPTNVAFGGADGKTVYVTMQDRGRVEFFINDIVGRQF
ncbi:MAG TPA: SMP-30/gluconolactonase/LRE family protein [Cytophagaceae bacterium]|jgi:gluconolactonase|nr:SMP-30/gluconolactonase/LRE family protein [Cytophagaceae bacterium]